MRPMIILALFLGVIVSVWAGAREFSAHQFATADPSRAFQAIALEGVVAVPPSVRGQHSVMAGCIDALSPIATQFQVPEDIARVAARCDLMAQAVLHVSPTLSSAHLVQAQAAFLQQAYPGMVAALEASVTTAPRTLWLAARRVQLVHDLPAVMQPLLADQMQADLGVMFESRTGQQVLASLYQRDRTLRAQILAVAETRPQDQQRGFLSLTRRAAQQGDS